MNYVHNNPLNEHYVYAKVLNECIQSPSIECYVFVIVLCGVLCTHKCFNGSLCVHNSPMHVCLMCLELLSA